MCASTHVRTLRLIPDDVIRIEHIIRMQMVGEEGANCGERTGGVGLIFDKILNLNSTMLYAAGNGRGRQLSNRTKFNCYWLNWLWV